MTRIRFLRTTMVLMFALAVFAVPTVAQASVLEYQMQLMPVGDNGLSQMIVSVILTADTELPATVKVPLPTGASLLWSGEIVGEDPTLDPYREATVTAVSGAQMVEFVLSESRVGQVEADYLPPTRSGNDVSSSLQWINTGEDAPLLVSVRLEPGVSDVSISPSPSGDPISNEVGETLYALESVTLAAGEALDISVSYTLGGASSVGWVSTALIVAVALLLVAIVALILVVNRDRRLKQGVTPRVQEPETDFAFDEDEDDELTF
ncbi:MAG: hypothetical protein JXE06_03335 [Coriobacteriia bacterium]|nr:hypothetical protein [Coriobacteriia bacterium]MBN2823216.1 hypothetical protein [Coriobacteriia bacterium]